MADSTEILYDKQRNGVLITLNRPDAMNAATRPMLHKLDFAGSYRSSRLGNRW